MPRQKSLTDDQRRARNARRIRLWRARAGQTGDRPRYLPSDTYARLADVLSDPAKLDKLDAHDRLNAIRIALGEIGNIWPDAIAMEGKEP